MPPVSYTHLDVYKRQGGARAGNIASTMAVELFMEEFLSRKEDESDRVLSIIHI